jgi:hypothetical protein
MHLGFQTTPTLKHTTQSYNNNCSKIEYIYIYIMVMHKIRVCLQVSVLMWYPQQQAREQAVVLLLCHPFALEPGRTLRLQG